MDTQKNMEERLWEFIDGISAGKEKEEIASLINTDTAWKKAYMDLMDMNKLIQGIGLEEPPLRFSKNVMDEIARLKIAPATKTYINKKIIYGIAGFFLIVIGGFLVYLFTQLDYSQSDTGLFDSTDFSFNWRQYISPTVMNMFFMADAVIGLMLLDRWLAKRKREIKETKA